MATDETKSQTGDHSVPQPDPEPSASTTWGSHLYRVSARELIISLLGIHAVQLTTLQRMNVLNLQKELVSLAAKMDREKRADPATIQEVNALLKDYVQAIRDSAFMRDLIAHAPPYNRLLLYEYDPQDAASRESHGRNTAIAVAAGLLPTDPWPTISLPNIPTSPYKFTSRGRFDPKPDIREDPDRFGDFAAFVNRLSMAVFGGIVMIGPMLIMTLHSTRATALATTSVFTFAVACILAYVMKDATPKDIIGATAAYAAVLVVFVGTAVAPASSG